MSNLTALVQKLWNYPPAPVSYGGTDRNMGSLAPARSGLRPSALQNPFRSPPFEEMKSLPATLHLKLNREYFAAIAAGTKTIEYRDQSPCWKRRLEGRKYDVVQSLLHLISAWVRNGHATDAPVMQVTRIDTSPLIPLPGRGGEGNAVGKRKFAIRLDRILKLKRWDKPDSTPKHEHKHQTPR